MQQATGRYSLYGSELTKQIKHPLILSLFSIPLWFQPVVLKLGSIEPQGFGESVLGVWHGPRHTVNDKLKKTPHFPSLQTKQKLDLLLGVLQYLCGWFT